MTPHRPLPKDREAGFTLVELLVVLVILALLAALVGPRVVGYMGQSRVKPAKIQIASYQTALELYHLDMGRYPALRLCRGPRRRDLPPVKLRCRRQGRRRR